MISASSVSTGIPLASARLGTDLEAATRGSCRGTANLILVLEAHATAHSAAPGARLQTDLQRPSHHDVDGRPRTIFSPERHSPAGTPRTSGTLLTYGP
jgi:hypothetical protein